MIEYMPKSEIIKLLIDLRDLARDDVLQEAIIKVQTYNSPDLREVKKGKWVGIHAYLDHLEEETGEKYNVSKLYDNLFFCNQCWKSNKKTNFCPDCGAELLTQGVK